MDTRADGPRSAGTPDGQARLCAGRACDAEVVPVLMLVSGRWAFPVLQALHLAGGRRRFRELQRGIGAISQKELLRQLHRFAAAGVVRRLENVERRRTVEYQLTDAGLRLLEPLSLLRHWPAHAAADRLAADRLDNWLRPAGTAPRTTPAEAAARSPGS